MGFCGNTEALESDRSKTRRVYLALTIPYRSTGSLSESAALRRAGFTPRGGFSPAAGPLDPALGRAPGGSSGRARKNLLEVGCGFWYIQWPDLRFRELDVRSYPGSRDGRHLCSFARIVVPHLKASSAGNAELRLARPRPMQRPRHLRRRPHRAMRPHRRAHRAMRLRRRLHTPRRPRRRQPTPRRVHQPGDSGARCSTCRSPASSRRRSSSSSTC
jgi:hypothetical protein